MASFSDEEIKRVLGDIALQIGEVYALKSTGSINDELERRKRCHQTSGLISAAEEEVMDELIEDILAQHAA